MAFSASECTASMLRYSIAMEQEKIPRREIVRLQHG